MPLCSVQQPNEFSIYQGRPDQNRGRKNDTIIHTVSAVAQPLCETRGRTDLRGCGLAGDAGTPKPPVDNRPD